MEPATNFWNTPQRQSPAAIGIMLLQTAVRLVKTFWPILVVYFVRKQKDQEGIGILWIILGFGLITIITTIVRYLFYTFHISNDHLIIKSGWLKKKTLSLPLKNIQAVHLEQNVWQQFLKVAKVTLDSSGSEKVEVKIDALSLAKAEHLKGLLLSGNLLPKGETLEDHKIIRLSGSDLLKLSLSANHLEAFFILFGLSINLIDDIKKVFNIDGWQVMEKYAGRLDEQNVMAVSILIILVAVISITISMIRTALRYYDFTLENNPQGWKIVFGLFSRQQLIVPFNKIQLLSWRANWIRKKLDFWVMHIQSTGHDAMKRKQRIHVPVTRLEQVIALSQCYQRSPVNVTNGELIDEAYWKRRILIRTLPTTVVLTGIVFLFTGIAALWILLLLPVSAWYHYNWYRNFRWTFNEEGLQLYSGVWGRRYTMLVWKKLQQAEIKQSIYQRRHLLASLKFYTAGGTASLPYIPEHLAKELLDRILYYVESSEEGWM